MAMSPRRAPKNIPPAPAQPAERLAIVDLDIASLLPNPRNPNRHSDDQLERLMASLKRYGQTRPVLARAENRMLIAGHGVTQAAARLGLTTLKVALLHVDQATADGIMLGDNRLAELSQTDGERVAELLREIDKVDWFGVGFTPEEADKMFGGSEELEVSEVETSAVTDEFWINVRGPLEAQAVVMLRIKQLLGEFPQVTVQLGTIAGD
jgi:hypothetical protein